MQNKKIDAPVPIAYQGKILNFSEKPILMAVLNVTPDSFYDGGRYLANKKAVERGLRMINEGADILDIGGASSRPGSDLVPDEIQIERTLPVIREIRKHWSGWVSIDTYSAEVARAAIEQGADIINDISAGRLDTDMKKIAHEYGVPCILMHMKGTPMTMQKNPVYQSLLPEIIEFFEERIREWVDAGVALEKILLDPGIGFGKTVTHNLRILKKLNELEVLGRPVVLGTSRKSFIGAVLDRDVEDRLVGTVATLVVGLQNGAQVFRVHDVQEARDALTMAQAIRNA